MQSNYSIFILIDLYDKHIHVINLFDLSLKQRFNGDTKIKKSKTEFESFEEEFKYICRNRSKHEILYFNISKEKFEKLLDENYYIIKDKTIEKFLIEENFEEYLI